MFSENDTAVGGWLSCFLESVVSLPQYITVNSFLK